MPRSALRRGAALALALLAGMASCHGSSDPVPANALRVLFIGNSLTYTNDLPAMVTALAQAVGDRPVYASSVAFPDYSLEDHWNNGQAVGAIRQGGWDVVVLQQGPSALPASRVLLLDYAGRFATEIARGGARPALYMVWPSSDRSFDFDEVSVSYTLAAQSVSGMLFPAGEAWRAAWRRDASLALYAPDGLHPTPAATYLNALVIVGMLFNRPLIGLPVLPQAPVSAAVANLLQGAAAEANQSFGIR